MLPISSWFSSSFVGARGVHLLGFQVSLCFSMAFFSFAASAISARRCSTRLSACGHDLLLLLDLQRELGLFVLEALLEAAHLLEAADAAALLRHLVQEGLHLGLALDLHALELLASW